MSEDPRCCGSGTCIINEQGRCWCGQKWDGQKMAFVPLTTAPLMGPADGVEPTPPPATDDS